MPKVTYRLNDGTEQTLEAREGESLMEIAMASDLEGILGRCGGECNCGTCHVIVDDAWAGKLTPPGPQEEMMLDGTPADRQANSRLSCQIKLSADLDGIVVTVAETQE